MSVTELAEWDWIVTGTWDRLHAPEKYEDPDDWALDEDAETACGLRGTFSIPGFFSRGHQTGVPRCAHCCRIRGYARGNGSPKNDPALRPLVEARLRAAQSERMGP